MWYNTHTNLLAIFSMHEPVYRQAIIQSWKLVWHHKVLWVFGLLSVLIGQFGLGDFFGQLITFGKQIFISNGQLALNVTLYSSAKLTFFEFLNWLSVGTLCLSLLVLTVFVAVTAQGALMAAAIDWYKKRKLDSFAQAWHKGVQHFWKILGINVLTKLLLGALLLSVLYVWATIVPSYNYYANNFFSHELVVFVLAVVMFVAFIVSAVSIYALGYVMSEDAGIFTAIYKGWRLFTHHVLASIELNLLLLLIGFVLIMVLVFGSFFALIPPLVFWLLGILFSSVWVIKIGSGLALVLLALLFIVSAALFNAFSTSAWMYLYMKMHHEGIASRLGHWAHHLLGGKHK